MEENSLIEKLLKEQFYNKYIFILLNFHFPTTNDKIEYEVF